MMKQRPIDLNPEPDRLEVFKINHSASHWRRYRWTLEAMRFIPHDGRASA
jgi:hypothetical protein